RTRLRTTALPRRRDVTKPARNGLAFSIFSTPSVSNLPRCVEPSLLTRSNSDCFINRRLFGNERFLAGIFDVAFRRRTALVLAAPDGAVDPSYRTRVIKYPFSLYSKS